MVTLSCDETSLNPEKVCCLKLNKVQQTGRITNMSYREVYEKWCNDPYFDEASREELKALEGNSVPADSAVSSERVPTA